MNQDTSKKIPTFAEMRSALMGLMVKLKGEANDPIMYQLVTRLLFLDDRERNFEEKTAEVDSLRAENERLNKMLHDHLLEPAVISSLQEDCQFLIVAAEDLRKELKMKEAEFAKLKEENERLSEAVGRHNAKCLLGKCHPPI